jgi:hypothetical protein
MTASATAMPATIFSALQRERRIAVISNGIFVRWPAATSANAGMQQEERRPRHFTTRDNLAASPFPGDLRCWVSASEALTRLGVLSLQNTRVSVAGLPHLKALPSLGYSRTNAVPRIRRCSLSPDSTVTLPRQRVSHRPKRIPEDAGHEPAALPGRVVSLARIPRAPQRRADAWPQSVKR